MANLGPLQQNLTYGNLLQVDGGLGAALKPVLDGDGNESGLSLSLTGVGISGLVAASASNLYSGSAGAVPYQVAANTTGFISAGITGQFLKSNGASAPAWTTIIPATIGALASDGSIPLTGDLSMGFHKITNLLTPSNSNDAATKAYVDSLATGLQVKAACRLATTANISLSGVTSVDGVTTSAGDRILVKSQTNPAQNGIYVASASAWTRATDADTWAELVAAATFITNGSTLANTTWVSDTTPGGTLGTTAINFVLFGASAAYTAGIGLDLIGSQFALEIPVSIANGGTGSITAETALNNLLPDQTDNEGKVLTTDGASVSWGSLAYDPSAVVITGGTIDGVSLGDTTPITSLTTSDAVDLSAYITVDPLVAAYLKSPRIWDTTQTHWYAITPSELVANRNVTLPVLSANDTFVFNENEATLKNKTISGADNVISNIANTSLVSSSITINGTPVDLGGSITVSGATSIFVSTITDLRAVNKATYQFAYVEGYYASGDGGGGNYYYDAADTTSADNGGTIIVATDGGRWKLSWQDQLSVKQFGAYGNGSTNDAPFFQNALTYLQTSGGILYIPPGKYLFNSRVTFTNQNISIVGAGVEVVQLIGNNSSGIFYLNLTGYVNPSPNIMEWRCYLSGFTCYPNVTRTSGTWGGSGTAIRIDRPTRPLQHQTQNQTIENVVIRLNDKVSWSVATSPQFDYAIYLTNASQTIIHNCMIDGPGCHGSTAIRVDNLINVTSSADSCFGFRCTNTDVAGWQYGIYQTGWLESVYIDNSSFTSAVHGSLYFDGSGTTLNGTPGTYNGHFVITNSHINAQSRGIAVINWRGVQLANNNIYLQWLNVSNAWTGDIACIYIDPGAYSAGEVYEIIGNYINTAVTANISSKTNCDMISCATGRTAKGFLISDNIFNIYGGGTYAANTAMVRLYGNLTDIELNDNVFYATNNANCTGVFYQNTVTGGAGNILLNNNIFNNFYYGCLFVNVGISQVNGGQSKTEKSGGTFIFNTGGSAGTLFVNKVIRGSLGSYTQYSVP